MNKDYYEILGVDKNADLKQIKSAYRLLVKKYHPDVSKEADAQERFAEISQAYEVLGDENKKAQYDQMGHSSYTNNQQYGNNYGGFSQEDFNRYYRQTSGFEAYQTFSFSDLMKMLWKSFLRKPFSQQLMTIVKIIIFVIILIFLLRFFFAVVLPILFFFFIIGLLLKVFGSLFR